jgi:hypothetical protein
MPQAFERGQGLPLLCCLSLSVHLRFL